jgi:hypothetical protein
LQGTTFRANDLETFESSKFRLSGAKDDHRSHARENWENSAGNTPADESAAQFAALFEDAVAKHPARPSQMTLHDDRGDPM